MAGEPPGGETPKARVNRELIELLNELRVALPGVQVLLAFLLTVPFSQRFNDLGPTDRRVYFVAVLATALSSILLMAPSAHHRMRFRHVDKEQMLRVASALAIAGMACLAAAMAAVVYVITGQLYGDGAARWVAGVMAALTAGGWFLAPLLYRRKDDDRDG